MSVTSSAVTDLILETFRLNGELLTAGDGLIADLGLTSARWQVLGAIDLSSSALPVAHIARNMGLSRQAVQRLVNEMAMQDLVRFTPNPHHQRAKLVLMTAKGRAVFDAAMNRQRPWADHLASGLSSQEVCTALRVLQNLRSKLQSQNDRKPVESESVEEFV
jgi:DNA-binding MarR family transcriptional regulator